MPMRDLSAIDRLGDGLLQGLSKVDDGGVCGARLEADDDVIC